jgi:hypothetical protein
MNWVIHNPSQYTHVDDLIVTTDFAKAERIATIMSSIKYRPLRNQKWHASRLSSFMNNHTINKTK